MLAASIERYGPDISTPEYHILVLDFLSSGLDPKRLKDDAGAGAVPS